MRIYAWLDRDDATDKVVFELGGHTLKLKKKGIEIKGETKVTFREGTIEADESMETPIFVIDGKNVVIFDEVEVNGEKLGENFKGDDINDFRRGDISINNSSFLADGKYAIAIADGNAAHVKANGAHTVINGIHCYTPAGAEITADSYAIFTIVTDCGISSMKVEDGSGVVIRKDKNLTLSERVKIPDGWKWVAKEDDEYEILTKQ